MTKPLALVVGSINDIAPVKYLIKSFHSMGWETFVVSDKKSNLARVNKYGAIDISGLVKKFNLKPEFLLFVEGGEMGIFPANFAHLDFPSIWWGIDTHNDYLKHLRISRLFDHSLIAQKSFVESLRSDGITSVSWFPLASPISTPSAEARDIDVSYIGSTNWTLYPQRGKLLNALSSNVENCVFGQQSAAEMLQTYSRSKVVFNNSLKNDVNMRIFEAMGAGALLVTNPILNNGMEDLFEEGSDYISYTDATDLRTKVINLLQLESERAEIAQSGMRKIHSKHTYDIRAEEITVLAKSLTKNAPYDLLQESVALISMGMVADSIGAFRTGLKDEGRGSRSKLSTLIATPILLLAQVVAKALEKILLARRLFS
jgi:hypothetical protein